MASSLVTQCWIPMRDSLTWALKGQRSSLSIFTVDAKGDFLWVGLNRKIQEWESLLFHNLPGMESNEEHSFQFADLHEQDDAYL